MAVAINTDLAKRVLEVVDAGLSGGLGKPEPGKMCVEAAVCYAMDLPHSDKPTCVSSALRQFKIVLNDARWSSKGARAKGLRRLAVAQLGSASVLDEVKFADRLAAAAQKWANAADAAAYAAAAAAYAADAAANAAHADAAANAAAYARDKVLAECAEDVVKILIEMKAPGCEFLYLTESAS